MLQYDPNAVMVRYQVREECEAEFQAICAEGRQTNLRLGLIREMPHLLLRGKDESGKPYYLELVPWIDRAVTGNPPEAVRELWGRLEAVCEARPGHRGIEIPDLQILK